MARSISLASHQRRRVAPGARRTRSLSPAAPERTPRPQRERQPWRHPLLDQIVPERGALIRLLRQLGTQRPGALVNRYGARDVAAALYYVLCQSRGYRARNPGGLLRWLLDAYRSRKLQGWQLLRLRGFCFRFREAPAWVKTTLLLWLKSLQWAWLGRDGYRRLCQRYPWTELERALVQRPWPGFWRRLRCLLALVYRPLPESFSSLMDHADRLPEGEELTAWAQAREEQPLRFILSEGAVA